MDTGRARPYAVAIKWARTVNIRALADFVQCAPLALPGC
jgi:hypothetical protein